MMFPVDPPGRPATALLKRLLRVLLGKAGFARFTEWRIAVSYVFKNFAARMGASPRTPWVCEFSGFDPLRSHAYARDEYDDYLRHAGLTADFLRGKVILEIGPGENLAVAARFLLAGATRIVCADRFPSLRPPGDQLAVYRLLDHEAGPGRVLGEIFRVEGEVPTPRKDRLEYIPGLAAESLHGRLPMGGFDLILSRAVMEHVFDPAAALKSMDAVLKPGGLMLHEIDLRDHGMFSASLHPLTFLRFPRWLWNLMSSHIGAPNRRFSADYKNLLLDMGYKVEMWRVLELGSEKRIFEPFEGGVLSDPSVGIAREMRPRFARDFQAYADQDLSLGGLFLVATKP